MQVFSTMKEMEECKASSSLFAKEAALIADSEEWLQRTMNEMGVVSERKPKANVNCIKVVKMPKLGEYGIFNFHMNGKQMEEWTEVAYAIVPNIFRNVVYTLSDSM